MRAGPVEGIDLASGDHEARSSFAPRRADLPKRKWEDECTDVSGSSMSTPPRESPERECTEESNEARSSYLATSESVGEAFLALTRACQFWESSRSPL